MLPAASSRSACHAHYVTYKHVLLKATSDRAVYCPHFPLRAQGSGLMAYSVMELHPGAHLSRLCLSPHRTQHSATVGLINIVPGWCIGQAHQSGEQAAVVTSTADEHEDKDGDVVMAEEDVEQLVASLQAARHASSEWETLEGPSSISMLLFGHQVRHPNRRQTALFLFYTHSSCHRCINVTVSWCYTQAL